MAITATWCAPHARLVYDSGDHASSFDFLVDDPACT